ncbi:MAG TPA: M1 family aminopeptidase [Bacteroidia bacterium]|jgi:aminopeptidase N|nr:M1 family aminopeptidase [Bacteroidia bacterium]
MKNKLVAGILTVVMLACTGSKKTQTTVVKSNNEPAINLDTIKVVANPEPKKKIYRGSNSLTNDIINTKLEVSFDWNKSQLIGKAEIHAKPYFYPTNMLYLDARGMEIKSVKVDEVFFANEHNIAVESLKQIPSASYTYENDSLKINLGKVFTAKEDYYVEIEYIAKPNDLKKGGSDAISDDKGLYFINPKGEDPNKMPQVWTQGETQSNSAWFPCVDSPNEKATSEILMTVDNKYTTLSNGVLKNSKKNADGTRTDDWKMDLPHSSYLMMMGVGEFKKVTDEPWKGKEISYYVEKEYEPHAKAIFGNTKEMIDFYSKKLGVDYVWPKYSQIVVRDYVSGAMENTSATLHGDFMVYQTTREMIDGKKADEVICHELFHQWFGDLVTAESWSNLPLNESFATYGEYLWNEYKNGRDAADEHHAGSRFGYMASSERKEVDLIRFDYDNREDMFDAFSYNKGGQVLHMLRKAVGDEAFFASLKLYLETRKFKSAEIHDLRLAFEETTGKDMNWFFNEWFLNKGHPVLNITKTYDDASKKILLTVIQKQDFTETPLYKLPVYIDIYAGGKKDRQLIWIDDVKQTFTLNCAAKPDLVNFDGERQLLAKLTYEKSKEEYLFQSANAPLWQDRDEALTYFSKKLSDKDIYEVVKGIAQNDKWKGIRQDAISFLGEYAKGTEADLKTLFLNIANNDASTKVRAEAIHALALHFTGDDLTAMYEKGLSEQSYAINAECLEALTKVNPTLAMQKAKSLENETGKKLIYAIADLYANNGNDDNEAFFTKAKTQFNGFELLGFGSIYGKFLKRCTKPETAITGANNLASMTKGGRYVKYGALRVMKTSLVDVWEGKEKKLKTDIETAKKENKDVTAMTAELKTATETKDKLNEIYNTVK